MMATSDSNVSRAEEYFAAAEQLLAKRFRLRKTMELVRHGLALAPEAPHGHDLLGRIELRRKRWVAAEAAYRRALELDPQNWVLMNNLGIALRGQRRQREAIEAFENAARMDPRSAIAAANLHTETIRYLGAGVPLLLALLVVARLLTLLPSDRSGRVAETAVILGLIMAPLAVIYLRNRRRLSRTARTFHAVQSRRSRKIYVPMMALTMGGGALIVYLGARSFLAEPTITHVIRVTAFLISWVIGFPAFAVLLTGLLRSWAPWLGRQFRGVR